MNRMRFLPYSLIQLVVVCLPLSSFAQELDSFEHHPDIELSLFASEPDVVDPVAIDFAADGTCYVVEMRDYPYGIGPENRPGGTVRLLRDRDQDGRADQSVVFATDLSFPTSVKAWKNGILVCAPPQVLYLEDTDGDDRADVKRVVVDGLRLGVTDSNANSLRFGLDNRLHLANGGNGGKIFFPQTPDQKLSIRSADLSVDLDQQDLKRTWATGGGFGLIFDSWGNRFTTYNIEYLQQQIMPLELLESRPELPRWELTHSISDHGASARIYPIVEAVTRVNHPEQAGHFSSAGGMGIIPAGSLFPTLDNSIFVCDVVCNIVHRDQLYVNGPIFGGRRAEEEQTREFIASRDPDFRPIGLEHGPDGAIYLLDMQRAVIEHPDYIPEKVLQHMDVREGENRGRIYRIVPRDSKAMDVVRPAALSEAERVIALGHPNPWVRDTAQRLLWENRSAATSARVSQDGLGASQPEARVRSLWLLDSLGQLSEDDLLSALKDSHHGVRQTAVRLAANHPEWSAVRKGLVGRLQDEHPHVRYWAALSVSSAPADGKAQGLWAMLKLDATHPWSRRAVYVGANEASFELLQRVVADPNDVDVAEQVLRELSANVVAALPAGEQERLVAWAQQAPLQLSPELQKSLLTGFHEGWERRPAQRLDAPVLSRLLAGWENADSSLDLPLFDLYRQSEVTAPAALQARLTRASTAAGQPDAPRSDRLAAIRILARLNHAESTPRLVDLLNANEDLEIQQAALEALQQLNDPKTALLISQVWTQLRPTLRTQAIQLMLSRRNFHSDLLDAVEQERIAVNELNLDLEQRRTLLRWSTPEIAERAKAFWGDEEYSNRKAIVEEWLSQLPEQGNVATGKQLFVKHCATCHQAGDVGNRVGPELTSQSHRSVEDLLSHILDPNMAINPNYVTCVAQTVDGRVVQGLLAAEDKAGVTLIQADGKRQTIAREQIETLETLKTSLMPEGIEKELNPVQMRSLIAFLQQR